MISEANMLAFEFVQMLANELNAGDLDLPSFPDVAMSVRKVVEDENCTVDKIVRVVGSEPALAGKLIQMSNSALMRRGDAEVTDLRTAINRLGHSNVRNAAISVAMKQLLSDSQAAELKPYLAALWTHSVQVSAICYALAKKAKLSKTPDEALLAGLLHDIGKLYILTRSRQHPELFADEASLQQILEDWHPAIGKSIIEHWELGEELAEAVENHEDTGYSTRNRQANLTDLLIVANYMAHHVDDTASDDEVKLPDSFDRLGVDMEAGKAIIAESREQIQALAVALA